MSSLWVAVRDLALRQWNNARNGIEREGGVGRVCPQAETVMLSLFALFMFLVIAILAILFPNIATKRAVLASNAILAGAVGITFILDVWTSKSTIDDIRARISGPEVLTYL